ncbi:hypothetical protein ACFV2H_14210 [Streptomyces sp. NPDC059629]|uniref:hypothetical protein n=1 Tax=Streptomyces sp. NPDC059629 TaxID=3346889 RepID=UPI0036C99769
MGDLKSRARGIDVDPELAYAGTVFHDLGLTRKCGTTEQRFEIDGADAAATFLREGAARLHCVAGHSGRLTTTSITVTRDTT